MRNVKMMLTGIAGLMLIATIIGLLMPSSVKISRGVILQADSSRVDQLLSDVHAWKTWLPWIQRSDEHKQQVKDSVFQTDSSLLWISANRKNEVFLKVTGRQPGSILLEHAFKGMNIAQGGFRISAVGKGQTELQWFMEYPLRWYPWERFYGIFLDRMFGSMFEEGFRRLEEVL